MSVQLIIYPQSYQGIHSSTSTTNTTNLVADGKGFNTIGNHTGYASSANNPALDAVTNDTPTTNWKKFKSQGSSAYADVDYPVRIGGFSTKLRFKAASGGSNSSSGVYQEINNLVAGATYQLKFRITNSASGGFLFIGASSFGNNLGGGSITAISTSTSGIKTYNFTAGSTTEILILDYQNNGSDFIEIKNITIKGAGATPPTVITDLFDGQVICDLYEDEDIPLTLSIDDFKNVAEKTQSYSKDFNLPATKRNNKIFTQIFEITNSVESNGDSFNPYIQTQCVLKQDGNIIFRGYLKLLDIVNKDEEISYNVNLYSESIVLVDVLKNKKFLDLDFSELEHEYNKTNIEASWDDSVGITLNNELDITSFAYDAGLGVNNTTVLKYPFVDWTGDLTVDNSNMPVLNKLEDAFRPFINCKYILNKIFDDAGFTFTSSFFDSSTFTNLFMDFNWGAGNAPVNLGSNTEVGIYMNNSPHYAGTSYTELKINIDALGGTFGSDVDYNTSTNKITSVNNNSTYIIDYFYDIVVNSGLYNYSTRWLITRNDGTTEEKDLIPLTLSTGGIVTYSGNLTITLDLGETAEAQFLASHTNSVFQRFDNINSPPQLNFSSLFLTKSVDAITDSTLLNNLRGDLAQWDFLKSIINMFNLIIRQDETNPTNLLIETYDKVFNDEGLVPPPKGLSLLDRNITHDWTSKVDATEIKLTPLNLVKETMFDYAEDETDYITNLYKNTFSSPYGSEVFTARGNTIFEGSEKIEAIAFSATVVKPLFDYLPQFLTPAIFSKESGTYQSFDNLPRILYKTSSTPFTMTDGTTYKIPAQNGVAETAAETRFLKFSHTTELPPTSSSLNFNFGTNQLIGIAGNTLNSLYQENWATYFDELYNFDTKSMTVKVNLNAADISQFNFNDKVMIMNRSYRVNRIDYKPNDLSIVEFILIP